MNKEIKQQVIKIINTYAEYGPRWKPGKDLIHLKKRIARRDVSLEFTLTEYNSLIVKIITNKSTDIHLYKISHFEQTYLVFTANKWLVIIGENTIMETAMISKNPERYLAEDKGYTYIGTVEEVLKWNTFD